MPTPRCAAIWMFTTLYGCTPSATPAPPAPRRATPPAAVLHAPGRIVAIGDVHSDPEAAMDALRLAGVLDGAGGWSGADTWLVQTGDLLDRGPDSMGTLALMRRLEGEATHAGGRVFALNGNHEIMNFQGDWRYVSEADVAGYGGKDARKAAFRPDGPEGAWVISHDITVNIDGNVFVHGGISPTWAAFGTTALNAMARAALLGQGPPTVLGDDGPLWSRAYLQSGDTTTCPQLTAALVALNARRMIVGHTVQESGRIAERCGGQLYGIDTGLSSNYGRHLSALVIDGDEIHTLSP